MAGDRSRLFVHVEGQTEEKFVYEVLAPHLYSAGYKSVVARLLGNQRSRASRGGIRPWASARIDIVSQMLHDPSCIATTMVDYYGLPYAGDRAWPGRAEAGRLRFAARANVIEEALAADLAPDVDVRRFLPFVVMHEFEGLLFSDCAALSRAAEMPSLQVLLEGIRARFETPEDIDDSPDGAPSKRIRRLLPRYDKVLLGSRAALEIGLEKIRGECPHFDGWVRRLEQLA